MVRLRICAAVMGGSAIAPSASTHTWTELPAFSPGRTSASAVRVRPFGSVKRTVAG
ncbi:hypothetical protein SVIO_105110 [Streptomyces violaceusniger]|uniref:Secreted protein n=1 Tax=Streptomyces violaceusniger TaxID=68280 RepID=A0A4D4LN86_STRVO|nr:hypothetical protein SVIO_105110 [Streptomyces violaceusniger]